MKELENLIGEKESKIYLSLIESGPETISEISQDSGIPRSTIYLLIETLIEKGLVTKTSRGKKTLYVPENPDYLVTVAKNMQKEINQTVFELGRVLPEMKAIHKKNQVKPIVKYYEGLEGIRQILEESLNYPELLFICSGYDNPIEENLETYLDYQEKQIKEKNISCYSILGKSPVYSRDEYKDKFGSAKWHIKYYPDYIKIPFDDLTANVRVEFDNPHTEKLIFGNKVVLISYEHLNVVVIENKQISDFERGSFFMLWENII